MDDWGLSRQVRQIRNMELVIESGIKIELTFETVQSHERHPIKDLFPMIYALSLNKLY